MTHSTEVSMIHQMADAMIDLLTYAQYRRIRTAAEKGGFDAGLKAITRVSQQIAAEKVAAAQDAAFQQGRLIGLQIALDVHAPAVAAAHRPQIVRAPVKSKVLKSVGFQAVNAYSGTLEVEFHSGKVYQYADVPAWRHECLMDAPSKGTYFTQCIRDVYTTTEITDVR